MTLCSLKPDSAISNTIGFVMITGILLTSLAMVFMLGLPVYNNYVDQSHMQNMIEGFDLISENGNNVAMLKTPYQQSELKLYEGSIAEKDAGTMLVEVYSDPAGNTRLGSGDSASLKVLEYTKGDSQIAYLVGGVFRKDDYSYPVIKEPAMYMYTRQTDNTQVLVLPLITLYDNDVALAGNGLARISFSTLYYSKKDQIVQQPVLHTYNDVQLVRITLKSDYNKCLQDYFEDYLGFAKNEGMSSGDTLVLEKTYTAPGITVNTIQTTVIVTINAGSI